MQRGKPRPGWDSISRDSNHAIRCADSKKLRRLTLFCSFLPFTYAAGAILPVSGFLPLSLIWTFSGRRWFSVASSVFVALRVPDLRPVYAFLTRALQDQGIASDLVIPITLITLAVALSSFVLETWLVKKWMTARVRTFAPRLLNEDSAWRLAWTCRRRDLSGAGRNPVSPV